MKRVIPLIVPLAALLVVISSAFAQSGGTYNLQWFSVDGGGGKSTGGTFSVTGIAGQPEAGLLSGGVYKLTGGFMGTSLPNNAVVLASNQEGVQVIETGAPTDTDPTAATTVRKGKKTKVPKEDATPASEATIVAGPIETQIAITACLTKPDKPKLRGRASKKTLKKSHPTLKWRTVPCAETYKIVIKNAQTGKILVKQAKLTTLKFKPDKLRAGKRYKWFIQACNASGCRKSEVHSFTLP